MLGIAAGIAWFAFDTSHVVTHGSATLETSIFRLPDQARTYATYGGSASCRECHEEEIAAWAGSHHGLAERAPAAAMDETAFIPARTFKHETQQTVPPSA